MKFTILDTKSFFTWQPGAIEPSNLDHNQTTSHVTLLLKLIFYFCFSSLTTWSSSKWKKINFLVLVGFFQILRPINGYCQSQKLVKFYLGLSNKKIPRCLGNNFLSWVFWFPWLFFDPSVKWHWPIHRWIIGYSHICSRKFSNRIWIFFPIKITHFSNLSTENSEFTKG